MPNEQGKFLAHVYELACLFVFPRFGPTDGSPTTLKESIQRPDCRELDKMAQNTHSSSTLSPPKGWSSFLRAPVSVGYFIVTYPQTGLKLKGKRESPGVKGDHDFSMIEQPAFIHRLAIEKQLLDDSFDSLDEISETLSMDLDLVKTHSWSTACSGHNESLSQRSLY